MIEQKDWSLAHKRKFRKHPRNKEIVTGRIYMRCSNPYITISIGITICELLDFKDGDRAEVLFHKKNKNILLIKKNKLSQSDYKIYFNKSNHGGRFARITFVDYCCSNYRISQTIELEYNLTEEKYLLVSLQNLKWEK